MTVGVEKLDGAEWKPPIGKCGTFSVEMDALPGCNRVFTVDTTAATEGREVSLNRC